MDGDVVENSEEEAEQPAEAEAQYAELRRRVQHATRVKELRAEIPFVDPKTGNLYLAGEMWPGCPIVDHVAIKRCILKRLQEAASSLKGAEAQAAKKRAKALAAQVARGEERQVDEPKPVTDVSSVVGLDLVRLPMLRKRNAHVGYEPPKGALRKLPPHLDFLSLSKEKYDKVTDILYSDGTVMPYALMVLHEQDNVSSIEPQKVIRIFDVLAENLPFFYDGNNGVRTRPQVACAGHTTLFSSALRHELRFAPFRWCEVFGGSPRARMDVLVWLGRSGKDWYEFCTSYWPFLQRGVLLVYPANVDAPGVVVFDDDEFQVSVIGGYRLKRCNDIDIIKTFIKLRKKEPTMQRRRQIRKTLVAKAMRQCGVVGIGDKEAFERELWRLVKKIQRLFASFASEPCGQKPKKRKRA